MVGWLIQHEQWAGTQHELGQSQARLLSAWEDLHLWVGGLKGTSRGSLQEFGGIWLARDKQMWQKHVQYFESQTSFDPGKEGME